MHGDDELDWISRELRMRVESSDPAARLLGHADLAGWSPSAIEQLLQDGTIRATAPDAFAECHECDEWHWEPVQWLGPKCFIGCSRVGLVPILPASLRRWQVNQLEGGDVEAHEEDTGRQPVAPANVFRVKGEFWELRYQDGEPFSLPTMKGLRDIWELLRRPGHEVSAGELVQATMAMTSVGAAAVDELRVDNGDGLELADEETIAAVKRRLQDLQEQLETARGRGDIEAALELEEQRTRFADYLSSTTDQDGKPRMALGARDRARTAVKNRVTDAITRIEKHSAGMALHFNRAIRTGSFLIYDPSDPVSWQLF
jgi:hypothetical protein